MRTTFNCDPPFRSPISLFLSFVAFLFSTHCIPEATRRSDYNGTASNLGFGYRAQPSPPRAKDIHVFVSSVGDILENKYVEVKEPSPVKPRHASGREQKWANLRQTSNNLGFSTVDDGSSSVPLVSSSARRVIPHDTPFHSSQTRDLLMHKFTDTPLPARPSTSLGRSSISSSMQVQHARDGAPSRAHAHLCSGPHLILRNAR
jgi:hypothetical protein